VQLIKKNQVHISSDDVSLKWKKLANFYIYDYKNALLLDYIFFYRLREL